MSPKRNSYPQGERLGQSIWQVQTAKERQAEANEGEAMFPGQQGGDRPQTHVGKRGERVGAGQGPPGRPLATLPPMLGGAREDM